METHPQNRCIAFDGSTLIASGSVLEVATAAKAVIDNSPAASVLVFDAETSRPVEIDFRGTVDEVLARLGGEVAAVAAPRAPGRPKLGVVAREVTLLPRHWEWLASQPGGASVTLRKLVEVARKANTTADRRRVSQDATYRFALTLAGDEAGFEESTRALYAGDRARFEQLTESWPVGVRDHARELATDAFLSEGE